MYEHRPRALADEQRVCFVRKEAKLAREKERRGPCAFLESVTIQTDWPAAERRKMRKCGQNENWTSRGPLAVDWPHHMTLHPRSADHFLILTQVN